MSDRLTRDQLEDIRSRAEQGADIKNDVEQLIHEIENLREALEDAGEENSDLERELEDAKWEALMGENEPYQQLYASVQDLAWRVRAGLVGGDTAIAQELEGLA